MIPENFRINGETLSVPNQKGFKNIIIKDIVTFESRESGTAITCMNGDDTDVFQVSLAALAEAFAPLGFFRIHNNCIVNTFYVKSYDRSEGHRVLMRNNEFHYVSRNNVQDFEEVMLKQYRDLMSKVTIRGVKSTGYLSN